MFFVYLSNYEHGFRAQMENSTQWGQVQNKEMTTKWGGGRGFKIIFFKKNWEYIYFKISNSRVITLRLAEQLKKGEGMTTSPNNEATHEGTSTISLPQESPRITINIT